MACWPTISFFRKDADFALEMSLLWSSESSVEHGDVSNNILNMVILSASLEIYIYIYHILYIIYSTSYILYHMFYSIYYISHIIYHILYIMYHMSLYVCIYYTYTHTYEYHYIYIWVPVNFQRRKLWSTTGLLGASGFSTATKESHGKAGSMDHIFG